MNETTTTTSTVTQGLSKRYEAYRICQERGHEAHHFVTIGGVTKGICKYCGTYFWTEEVLHEEAVPVAPV